MEAGLSDCIGGCTLALKVVPKASGCGAVPPKEGSGDVWQIRLTAPAVDGKANAALIEYLAELFGLRRRQIAIKMGEKARRKVVQLEGLSSSEAAEKLHKAASGKKGK